jgi:hypothetical protein
MSDQEFAVTLRGWKQPAELGEDVGPERSGVNPFTGKPIVMHGSRSRIAPIPVAEADAVRHPMLAELPQIGTDGVVDQDLDRLAMVLFHWSREYAYGEVSLRDVVGPDPASLNDWFQLVPARVVDAVAAIPDDHLQSVADQWTDAVQAPRLPSSLAVTVLRRMRTFCREAQFTHRKVYFWGTR